MSWKTFVAGGGGYTRGARGWTVVVATAVSGGSKSGWEVWRLQNGWWAAGLRVHTCLPGPRVCRLQQPQQQQRTCAPPEPDEQSMHSSQATHGRCQLVTFPS